MNAALLKPPPYPEPDRILVLGYEGGGNQDGQIFHYVRERARSFERLAAHSGSSGWNLLVGERAEYATGVPVSEGFFEVLGVAPLVGRGLTRVEDQANAPRAVVLSEPLWRRVL
ncbi:MAG: ABC transporter permease, partial [Vicinamibacterales bacterium]